MTSDITQSHWHKSCAETVTAPALSGAVKADLVVVGGGYTGLSAALHGAKAGLSVRLIEAGPIGGGGSGRNVGLVNAGLWLPPEEITARIGAAAGAKLSSALAGAPDLVFDLIDEFSIQCEPIRAGTLHCAHAPSGRRDLENRHRQLTAIGAPVTLLSRDAAVARVGSDRVHGALFDPRAGTLQPLGFARGLARAAMELGAKLHDHSPAVTITRNADRWQIDTPNGQVTAPRLILATNAYTLPINGLPTSLTMPATVPVHYFQAATAPLSEAQRAQILPGREGCWDTAMVMSSFRLDQAGRLIIGGMGALNHPASGAHTGWVRRKLAKMFPTLAGLPLSGAWHGRIAMSEDYLPKTMAPGPDALTTFGYSGRGIGPGTLFGKAMAEALITGDMSPLPRAPVDHHAIPLGHAKHRSKHWPKHGARNRAKQVYYEAGATLTHLIKDRI